MGIAKNKMGWESDERAYLRETGRAACSERTRTFGRACVTCLSLEKRMPEFEEVLLKVVSGSRVSERTTEATRVLFEVFDDFFFFLHLFHFKISFKI
ncbi:hypothetical protein EUGRSUZ_H03519 [Eucalyptus grandis]|uniref:Uncharacterized protein n=2 Tax=Eucalyptus grandis TaxID=71139 RepID=A0ACC3JU08_EUCGR|nr:hypothetical protein EUGRSUZ_H03519 [Eucalyptus grandis]